MKPEITRLTLGVLPLNDAAPLVVALEHGLFAAEGLEVTLSVETSWAGLRDAMQLGLLDGAQLLALMPLASTLGLDGRKTPMLSALTLNTGGNAITVSQALYRHMEANAPRGLADPVDSARALAAVVEQRRQQGEPPLRFANVYPFSSHRYLLRYWMAAGGVDPDADMALRVVPPPLVASRLQAGELDGYCVGEPWNSLAEHQGIGRVICGSLDIWGGSQEKVFGVREAWAEQYPATHQAVLRALLRACLWLDAPGNRPKAARLMCEGGYLDVPPHVVEQGMRDPAERTSGDGLPGATRFHRHAANFPWRSQTMWYAAQMRRWGHLDEALDLSAAVERCVRPALYRQAAEAVGLSVPVEDTRVEGAHAQDWTLAGSHGDIDMAPDAFMDGARFSGA
ncbi:CmpA/NrtA family ABC transporter substrate-binding protein [Litchfieldella xinjiangensis]|uniref:CmpA/NrtA family ABC transporter substrate-binding protein n=1 Tax=Litchfieldella xinjiangensis TaxID=1166948 RepID=UPI0005BA45C9|nr:CmpA/NrtA family ABC transporter substrate-binding protein [Halomonas xinjiangensis]